MESNLTFTVENSVIKEVPIHNGNHYYYILKLFAFYAPMSTLGEREMQILSLIWREYKDGNGDVDVKYDYVFSGNKFKDDVCKRLSISKANYNNVIKNLRKKKFIDGKRLAKTYELFLDNLKDNIIFSFVKK